MKCAFSNVLNGSVFLNKVFEVKMLCRVFFLCKSLEWLESWDGWILVSFCGCRYSLKTSLPFRLNSALKGFELNRTKDELQAMLLQRKYEDACLQNTGEEAKGAHVFESHLMRQCTKILALVHEVQECRLW